MVRRLKQDVSQSERCDSNPRAAARRRRRGGKKRRKKGKSSQGKLHPEKVSHCDEGHEAIWSGYWNQASVTGSRKGVYSMRGCTSVSAQTSSKHEGGH